MQITRLAMSLVASSEGANALMAQIRPRKMESASKRINQDMTLGFSANGR